jgi:hypothetical protein
MIVPTVLLPLPWYVFLKRTYGDFTAFHATQELQADWNHPAGTFVQLLASRQFHLERLKESWGYFGWRLIPLSTGELRFVYLASFVCLLGIVVGLVRYVRRSFVRGGVEYDRHIVGVSMLVLTCVLFYLATIYFGTMFMLTQARYFFPMFPAAAVIAMLGVESLVPHRARLPVASVVIFVAAAFQLLLLLRAVIPYALA